MNSQIPNFFLALPEMWLLLAACVILVVDVFGRGKDRNTAYLLSQVTLAVAAVITVALYSEGRIFAFNDSYVSDTMGTVLKAFIYLVTAAVFIYSRDYLRERDLYQGEFFVLALFGVLGMMIMVSAHSFLTIYLGLELLSLSLYAMVALKRDDADATEAAMKYFVLGALASGMLLYGMSILYGVTGTLDVGQVAQRLVPGTDESSVVLGFAVVFVIVGLAFKLGAVPFHMWIPDVYHGAPTPVTLFVGTAPKIAAFAMIMRLLVEGLGDLHAHWRDILIVLAVLSMGIGNIVAIAQTNLKRMLAYSTISHVGFLLLGILSGTENGYASAMFYTLVYAIMSAGGFGMILLLSRSGFEADRLEDFKGLNDRSPWYAFMMLILMFSMAGVPPTLGFYAKLSVIQSLVDVQLVWLAVLAVVFSIIGAFYYLRMIKLMYFDKPQDTAPLRANLDLRAVISINALSVLALGLYPSALMNLCIVSLTQL
jgi:NADH-quinone oxidoreductase subunit N